MHQGCRDWAHLVLRARLSRLVLIIGLNGRLALRRKAEIRPENLNCTIDQLVSPHRGGQSFNRGDHTPQADSDYGQGQAQPLHELQIMSPHSVLAKQEFSRRYAPSMYPRTPALFNRYHKRKIPAQ
jgi:hypothetical protein